jgi:hypothetical protein
VNRREFITLNFVQTGEAAMMCWALGFVGGVAYRPIIKVQPIKLLRAAFLTILSLLAAPCAGVGQQPKKSRGSAF